MSMWTSRLILSFHKFDDVRNSVIRMDDSRGKNLALRSHKRYLLRVSSPMAVQTEITFDSLSSDAAFKFLQSAHPSYSWQMIEYSEYGLLQMKWSIMDDRLRQDQDWLSRHS